MLSQFCWMLAACVAGVAAIGSTGSALAVPPQHSVAAREAHPHQHSGKFVMPKAGARFMIGKQEVSPRDVVYPLHAQRVDPKWVWVGSAWIRADEVLPLTDAEAYYTEFLREHTCSPWAYYCRALCRRHRGEFAGAASDLSQAIHFSPHDPMFFHARGNTRLQQGKVNQALADYDRALELDDDLGLAYYGRGVVREKLGQYDRAIDDFERALELNPKEHRTCGRLAWVLSTSPHAQLRDGPRAVQLATRACELSRWQLADPIDTLAAAHAECGDFDQAVKFQEQALRLSAVNSAFSRSANERIALYRQRIPVRQETLGDSENAPSPFRLLANDSWEASQADSNEPVAR